MTEINILNGWRHPDEKPINGVYVLTALRNKKTGFTFISIMHSDSCNVYISKMYDLLAWQYCPVWQKED